MDEKNKLKKKEEPKTEEYDESTDEIENIQEILSRKDIPDELKVDSIMRVLSVQMQGGVVSSENMIAKKIDGEHITQFLEGSKSNMENSYREKKHRKILIFAVLLLTMVFVVIVILLLRDKPDTMEKVIYSLGGLAAGALGGYGFGKSKRDDQ